MIRFESDQLSRIGAQVRQRFIDDMVAHMTVRSTLGLAPDALRARTIQLIEMAERSGIDAQLDVRRFIELVFDGGAGERSRAEVAAVLRTTGVDAPAKVAMVAAALAPAARRQP